MPPALSINPVIVEALPGQRAGSAGFTLVEMLMVIVIMGILAAFVAPRITQSPEFAARGFADQVKATLRYAQKSAIAQHRYVCVAFSVNSIGLTVNAVPTCPGTGLASADGSAVTRVEALHDGGFAAIPSDFYFDALGRPGTDTAQRLRIVGMADVIVIEAETGYVH
ncbi:type II secretion system protein [Actimicrobium sp. CCI2.3]|uniref:type II secretion system protein n=1 Tax=Actimicrobium sp. CCI2.3 TaxID=3048616 RepID=UPI002AB33EBB|nr:type II secretion system protein [Actimicrobium sp. CCI2.3]MDY7572933.1 type II secretion system protein [Actimicrobium sp. CCI2.3]MEB0020778.1 type II secretion system protein [Actimicrobium sp. CCI2.3]